MLFLLLAKVLLDEVDKALQLQGSSFARSADDSNVYVGGRRTGERVMTIAHFDQLECLDCRDFKLLTPCAVPHAGWCDRGAI